MKKLSRDAESFTNSEVQDVVIAVPTCFGDIERDETRKAGVLAGLNIIDIIDEPVAALLFYECEEKNIPNQVVCVFDLGSNTLDITAVKVDTGLKNIKLLASRGNHNLGGNEWHQELINMVKEKFREETRYNEKFDIDVEEELKIKCENAKKQLTNANEVTIPMNVDRNTRAKIKITREEFALRTDYLISSAIGYVKKVFNIVDKSGEKVDKILLVGGSTFIPQIKERLEKNFGVEVKLKEPEYAVTKGACRYCSILKNLPKLI